MFACIEVFEIVDYIVVAVASSSLPLARLVIVAIASGVARPFYIPPLMR